MADIKSDLSRRDFTINAIAKLKHGEEYFDPFGGREDIERNLIRCVGSAKERLSEDPLRGLRAIRFMVTKGFNIDHDIWEAMADNKFKNNFETLTKERVREELFKMFKYDTLSSLEALNKLKQVQPGVLEYIFNDVNIWLMPTLKKLKK